MKKNFLLLILVKLISLLPIYSQSKNYTSLGYFHDGIAPAILENKLGYIDTNGTTVIPFIYDIGMWIGGEPKRFNKNFISLCLNNKCGVVSLKQDTIVPFKYDLIRTKNGFDFDNPKIDNVIVSIYRKRNPDDAFEIGEGFYNIKSQNEYFPQNASYTIQSQADGNYLAISQGKSLVFIDTLCNELVKLDNNIVIGELGNKISSFSRQIYDKQTGSYQTVPSGFLDNKTGKIVIDAKYKYTYPFNEGFTFVCNENNKWGMIDNKGRTIIPFIYDETGYDSKSQSPVITVSKDNKWGFIDKEGKTIIPFEFDYAENFKGKYAIVGYNTSTLKPKSDFDFPPIETGNSQLESKKEYLKKYSIIDIKGLKITSSKYDWASSEFQDGITTVMKNNQIFYINENGKIINEAVKFEVPPNSLQYIFKFNEGLAPIYQNNKWGFINKNGVLKIQAVYDKVGKFEEGFINVMKNGKWFFIDANGKCKINCPN